VPQVTLAIIEGSEAGREFPVTKQTVIGRDPAADLVIADSGVSTKHASFVPADGGLTVQDLGSRNGTFVNDQRLSASQLLQPGDRVQLGSTVLEVRGEAPPPAPAAAPAASAPPPPVNRPREIPTLPILVFLEGAWAGSEMPVGTQLVVGRDPGASNVVLDQETELSRRHAAFSPAGTGLTVTDLGSTNGTIVNGYRIEGTVALNTGDRVQLGSTVIEVRLAGEIVVAPPAEALAAAPDLPANTIEVEQLVKDFGESRAVDAISLWVNPGEVYGFLGPNGAGKSTTVHMLVTLLPPTWGTARVAGYDVAREGPQVRASIGVALQAAALDPHLNAWEHMDLQTSLQGIPKRERASRAAELLERVDLTYAADRRVGDYSGGMKRRLDLALALVHRPRVLFLDEPTTGLDPQSRTALWEEVARLVKEEGMTVFLTTQYLEEADVLADRVGIIDHGEIVAEDTPGKLKAEIGRPTVEVLPMNGSDYAAISEVLSRFGELASAAHRGVAVRLAPGIDDMADVIRALDAQGLRFTNVELHAPTLDDVFLAKTGRSLGGAGEEPEEERPVALEQLSVATPGAPNPDPYQ
jgi:ABC-2 type transport system ATP-binding protein